MKIKLIILACLMMWSLVFSQFIIDVMCEERVSFEEAFAIDDEIEVNKCSYEIVSELGVTEAENVIKGIMECNGCSDYKITRSEKSVNAKGNVYEYIVEITVTRVNENSGGYLRYHICNEEGKYNQYTQSECYEKSEATQKYLNRINNKNIMYARFDGVINEEMTVQMCKKYTERILDGIGASQVSEYVDADYTAYGYLDKLKTSVESNGSKINVQLRFSFNEITRVTEVVVATPLIMD